MGTERITPLNIREVNLELLLLGCGFRNNIPVLDSFLAMSWGVSWMRPKIEDQDFVLPCAKVLRSWKFAGNIVWHISRLPMFGLKRFGKFLKIGRFDWKVRELSSSPLMQFDRFF